MLPIPTTVKTAISEPSSAEAALVLRMYQRDESAMVLFYDKYGAMLYGVILRLVRNSELAEDILQESMLKIWRSFPTYTAGRGRLATWALNICRNKAIDELRAQRVRGQQRTTSLTESDDQQQAPTSFRPEHIGVRELVGYLSPTAQELLDLLYFKGFTQQEAAEVLGLPLGTVKTRARTAINMLARQLRTHELAR